VDRLMGLSISPIVKLGLNELEHIWAARFLAPFREAKSTTEFLSVDGPSFLSVDGP
jgi:hypothetical protein